MPELERFSNRDEQAEVHPQKKDSDLKPPVAVLFGRIATPEDGVAFRLELQYQLSPSTKGIWRAIGALSGENASTRDSTNSSVRPHINEAPPPAFQPF